LTVEARLLLLKDNLAVIRARELWSSLVSKFKKRHPALKHGGYCSTAVLPGENPVEFEELHQALIAELAPTGALEENIVADIARLVWRRQNLATFRRTEDVRSIWFELRERKFYEEFPDAPATPDSPWSMLSDSERAKVEEGTDAMIDEARKKLGEDFRLVEIGDTATVEGLLRDLDLQERLDALIDKCLKRLLFVRGLKSLPVASSSAPPQPIPKAPRIQSTTKAA
jgi:hypothetical protein